MSSAETQITGPDLDSTVPKLDLRLIIGGLTTTEKPGLLLWQHMVLAPKAVDKTAEAKALKSLAEVKDINTDTIIGYQVYDCTQMKWDRYQEKVTGHHMKIIYATGSREEPVFGEYKVGDGFEAPNFDSEARAFFGLQAIAARAQSEKLGARGSIEYEPFDLPFIFLG